MRTPLHPRPLTLTRTSMRECNTPCKSATAGKPLWPHAHRVRLIGGARVAMRQPMWLPTRRRSKPARVATRAREDLPPSLDLVTLAGYHLAAHGTSRTRHSRTPVHARQPPLQECHSGETPVAALTPCAAHRRRVGGYAPAHVAPHALPSLASKSGNASTSGPASELGPRDFCGLPPCSTRHTTHAAQPHTRA